MPKVTEKQLYQEEPESDSDMELEEAEEEEETTNEKPEEKKYIYNDKEMTEKLLELQKEVKGKIPKKKPTFNDFMSIVSSKSVELTKSQVNDDIQREVVLYNITIENVKKALNHLEKDGIKTQRPEDFLAEMYKKDQVMQKIKSRLVKQQVKIQNFEEKKSRIENKRFAKKYKNQKEQDKHKEKRKNVEAINDWKEEIRTKGDKAKDLSDFILNTKDKRVKKPRKEEDSKRRNNFNDKVSKFSKKVQKPNNDRMSRKKQPKSKRPGKVTRMMMKNKKFSGKKGR